MLECVVAIDTVLRSLRGKILLRINKSWMQNFPRYEPKCSDQNSKVVQFYPWKVAILYFSGANDRIEIDKLCCLVLCSKQLYKWKSFGAGWNSSTIVVSIINTQWQLFDSDAVIANQWKQLDDKWRKSVFIHICLMATLMQSREI